MLIKCPACAVTSNEIQKHTLSGLGPTMDRGPYSTSAQGIIFGLSGTISEAYQFQVEGWCQMKSAFVFLY